METNKKPCKTCKKTDMKKFQTKMVIAGLYLIASSLYGTYHFIKYIVSLF